MKPATQRTDPTLNPPQAPAKEAPLCRRYVGATPRSAGPVLTVLLTDRVAGARLLTIATVGLCAAGLVLGAPVSTLPPWLPRLMFAIIGTAIVAAGLRRAGSAMTALVAGFWAAMLASDLAALQGSISDLVGLVKPCESAALLLAAIVARRPRTYITPIILSAALAALLILFGLVHVSHAQDVSALVPGWVPWRPIVPWITGVVLLVAGCAHVFNRTRATAAWIVSAMFTSWLVLVHAPRLQRAPEMFDEWRFALTAVALVGALTLEAAGRRAPDPSQSRSMSWKSWF